MIPGEYAALGRLPPTASFDIFVLFACYPISAQSAQLRERVAPGNEIRRQLAHATLAGEGHGPAELGVQQRQRMLGPALASRAKPVQEGTAGHAGTGAECDCLEYVA